MDSTDRPVLCRLLKAHDLITSPAFIVMKAADEFKDKTTAPNQLWQTGFTYLKVIGWGWFYLSRMRPEALLARDRNTYVRRASEGRLDLGPCGVDPGTGSLELSREGPESAGIELRWHEAIEAECLREYWADYAFLAMHRGNCRPFARQMELVA